MTSLNTLFNCKIADSLKELGCFIASAFYPHPLPLSQREGSFSPRISLDKLSLTVSLSLGEGLRVGRILKYAFVLFAFTFLVCSSLFAQVNNVKIKHPKGTVQTQQPSTGQTTQIEILGADLYDFTQANNQETKTLSGNVRLKNDKVFMYCDHAILSNDDNTLDASGHVKITQDTVQITSDSLHYDALAKKSRFIKNVTLTDSKKMNLATQQLDYDMATRIANYQTGGVLKNDSSTLTSLRGYYHANTKDAYFKHDVTLTNPQYNLTADTLRFNSDSRISYFLGPTNIVSDSSHVYCEGGYYNTESGIANFTVHARANKPGQFLRADSIYYDKVKRFGLASNNVLLIDTTQGLRIACDLMHFNGKIHTTTAMQCPLLTVVSENDSTYLTADTLKSIEDTVAEKRTFFAYHQVKIFKKDMQALCDSMVYKDVDSTFHLYNNPIVWMEKNQMKADTILLLMKNKNIDQVHLLKSGFISSKVDTNALLYDQMQGKNMYGYFENNEMKRLKVDGNGESVYFAKDDSGAYVGVNKIACSNMMIFLAKQEVTRIAFYVKPVGTFYPVSQAPKDALILKNFVWLEDKKPKSKEDLLK